MQAIIFDIDGTLLHSSDADEKMYRAALQAVLGPVEFRSRLDDYEFVTDTGILLQVLDDNAIVPDQELIARIQDDFVNRLTAHIATRGPFTEVDGALNIIARLVRSDRHLPAIATGGWRASAMLKLTTAGFDISGVPLATSDDAIDRPGIMKHALGLLGDEVSSVRYFGDGVWDRDACAQLGWRFEPVGPALNGLESFTAFRID